MATAKKGILTATGRWWKHLRWAKRGFWKGERQAAKKLSRHEAASEIQERGSGRPDDFSR
jgi:hypothetical protein